MSVRRLTAFSLALAACSLAAAPAFAGSFDDAAATAAWVARADSFTHAMADYDANGDYKSNLSSACSGVTGDMMKYGQHEPMWAQTSFSEFCSSVNVMGRNGLNKVSCKSFKRALGDIKAESGKDPDEVVRAAQGWQAALSGMIDAAKAQHQC